jgi:carbonic anhydrase
VLGVKLVLLLGHSDCGAVKSATAAANGPATYPPGQYGAIGAVVDRIVPPIQALPPGERTLSNSIVVNAQARASEIANSDPIIRPAVDAGRLAVVSGVYDIADGKVSLI